MKKSYFFSTVLTVIILFTTFKGFAQKPLPTLAVDIIPGSNSSFPENLVEFNGKLYFSMTDNTGDMELWQYDGSTAPTRVADINPGIGWSFPKNFIVYKNKLYFQADNGIDGAELYVFDGFSIAPSMVMDIYPGANPGLPSNFCIFNNTLYFQAGDATNGLELWKYDGTNAPSMVADVNVGANGSSPSYLSVFNNALYFSTDEGTNGAELWKYDGTNAPGMVADIQTGAVGSNPSDFIVYNGNLYFNADDGTNGAELWKYDGTNATMVKDINPGNGSSFPTSFKVFKNQLYFQAQDAVNGSELWAYDGVNAPAMVYDIASGSIGSSPAYFFEYVDTLYFRADDNIHGIEMWKYSGSGTPKLLSDLFPGTNGSFMTSPALFNDKMYFAADDSIHGTELFYISNCGTVSVNSTTICSGATATLTATPSANGGTYLWSNNSTTANITVSPTVSTTYTVSYTLNGCSSVTSTGKVTVNSSPTVTVNSVTICSGETTTLTATPSTTGGTYLWSAGTGSTTASISVAPTSATTYSVTYTLNGCVGKTIGKVTLKTLSTVSINSATVCSGTTTTLTATPINSGGTYLWSSGSKTTSSVSVAPTSTTTYSVTYTLNGCPGKATGKVTVNSLPTVSVNSVTVCSGTTTTLTATPINSGGTYLWSNNGTTANITVSPTISTTYSVTYTLNGCMGKATGNVTNGTPTLTVNNATVCSGAQAIIQVLPNITGGDFAWSTYNTDPKQDIIKDNPTVNKSYSVVYTLNGCSSASVTATVTTTPLPTVTIDPITVCAGATVTLTPTPSVAGGTYLWMHGDATTTAVNTIYDNNTPYTVRYTKGCTSEETSANIVFKTKLNVTTNNATAICPGLPVVLTVAPEVTGGTYTWTKSSATTNSITVAPAITTDYKVVYKLNGCSSDSVIATAFVNPRPHVTVDNAGIVLGASAVLTAIPFENGGTFKWLNNTATTNSITVNPTTTTTYSVVYTLNSCTDTAVGTVNLTSIIVTNLNDSGPGSLRQCIADANNGGIITFATPLTGTITLTSGELVINKNLTIKGPGANVITVSGNNSSRVFIIIRLNDNPINVTINDIAIINGVADGTNATGGGIRSMENLTLNNCILKNNLCRASKNSYGGAIYSMGLNSYNITTLTINTCTFTGNVSTGIDDAKGGAIYSGVTTTITNSELSDNSAINSNIAYGGAIYLYFNSNSSIFSIIRNCTIHNNKAIGNNAVGGGLCIYQDFSMENSTISSNTVTGNSDVYGGGIYLGRNNATINNSTISDNVGDGKGRMYGSGGFLEANLSIGNTIFNNNSFTIGDYMLPTSLGSNICSDGSMASYLTAAGDKNNTDPGLLPLAYNGGPTKTHALETGSPAINAGITNTVTPNRDQRGYCRNGAVDIGAYEYNGAESKTSKQIVSACTKYVWNATTYTLSGTYKYTTNISNGCDSTATLFLTINPNPQLSARFLNETAPSACDGYAEIVPVGGLSPYTYTWSDIGTTQFVRKNMCANTYSVLVTDANSCKTTAVGKLLGVTTSTITPAALNLSITSVNVSDPLRCDGSANVLVTGGAPTYTISFAGNNTTGNTLSIPNVCTGFYTVIVKDAGGTTRSSIFVLADASTTYTNTPTGAATSTISASAVSNCNIQYADIKSIEIFNATEVNNLYEITWRITYTTTSTPPTDIVQNYVITQTTGYAKVVLDLYCSSRASEYAKGIDYLQLDDIASSIDEESTSTIHVYPNPFSNELTVVTQKASVVTITDVSGKVLFEQKVNEGATNINTSYLVAGVYFVNIKNPNGSIVEKLVKY